MTARLHTPALSRPLSAPVRAVAVVLKVIVQWQERRRTRAALAQLDAHLLADIGLSDREAAEECAKPAWRD